MRSGGERRDIECRHPTLVENNGTDRASSVEQSDVASGRAASTVAHGPGNCDRLSELRGIRVRCQSCGRRQSETDIEQGMQLNAVGSHASLPVYEVEESNPLDLHRDVGHLKERRRVEA